jgi:transcription-repair coupling factor (superfamily II helicase)
MSEVTLTPDTISRFRKNYLSSFGAATRDDALYLAISEGRRYPGMEHWLPLFYETLETVFDYLKGFRLVTDHTVREAAEERSKLVFDYYEARLNSGSRARARCRRARPTSRCRPASSISTANPSPARSMRATRSVSRRSTSTRARRGGRHLDARQGERWARKMPRSAGDAERINVFDVVVKHIADRRASGAKVLITAWTEGSLDRLLQVLAEHGLERVKPIGGAEGHCQPGNGRGGLGRLQPRKPASRPASSSSSASRTFSATAWCAARKKQAPRRRFHLRGRRRSSEGDLVVHAEHGIGRFIGLRTIEAAGAPHDCLELQYAGDSKLFLPVENIELLSRYGSEGTEAPLDKLGGGAWQARKAKLKKRMLEMAGQADPIAAERICAKRAGLTRRKGSTTSSAPASPMRRPRTSRPRSMPCSTIWRRQADGPADLRRRRLRQDRSGAARRLRRAMNGKQVAVVVPTTLLARQHFKTFRRALQSGLPVRVQQASRWSAPRNWR